MLVRQQACLTCLLLCIADNVLVQQGLGKLIAKICDLDRCQQQDPDGTFSWTCGTPETYVFVACLLGWLGSLLSSEPRAFDNTT